MTGQPLAVLSTGIVSSVGFDAPATCAAIRAGLTNPIESRFMDRGGEWLMSHAVAFDEPWRGQDKLVRMAALVAGECLAGTTPQAVGGIPLLLGVAEQARPGRLDGLDTELLARLQQVLQTRFAPESSVIPHGRVSGAVALLHARKLIYESQAPCVLIVGIDSLLNWPTLRVLEEQERLLTSENSNGFIAGEAAAAVLVGKPGPQAALCIDGLGFAVEAAHIESEQPLRAEGLTQAIQAAVRDAGCSMHDVDYRITDISGEQYYFKEAALALARALRPTKEEFDLWHPAECIGEVGSAIGPVMLAVADAACRKGYAPGLTALMHAGADTGQRAAVITRFRVS